MARQYLRQPFDLNDGDPERSEISREKISVIHGDGRDLAVEADARSSRDVHEAAAAIPQRQRRVPVRSEQEALRREPVGQRGKRGIAQPARDERLGRHRQEHAHLVAPITNALLRFEKHGALAGAAGRRVPSHANLRLQIVAVQFLVERIEARRVVVDRPHVRVRILRVGPAQHAQEPRGDVRPRGRQYKFQFAFEIVDEP